MPQSQYLNDAAITTINRLGDIMLPRNNEFPSFSELGCIEHIDDVVGYAPPGDIKELNLLLSGMSAMPDSVLQWMLRKMQESQNKDSAISPLFRQMDFGLRGIINTLYYSGKTGSAYNGKNPLDIIGFEINRVPLKQETDEGGQ